MSTQPNEPFTTKLEPIDQVNDWSIFLKESVQEDVYSSRNTRRRIHNLLSKGLERLEETLSYAADMDTKDGRAFAINQGHLFLKAAKDHTMPPPAMNFSTAQQAARMNHRPPNQEANRVQVTHEELLEVLRDSVRYQNEMDAFKKQKRELVAPTTEPGAVDVITTAIPAPR